MSRRDTWILVGVTMASLVVAAMTIVCFSPEFKSSPSLLHFFASIAKFGPIEYGRLLSVVTGIVSVYLASRENVWVWPIGIVWCLDTAWVMYEQRFFGDMALMFVYFFLQIHGWWSWRHGSADRKELPIGWAPVPVMCIVVVFVAIGIWPAKEFLELDWVHGKAPLWDSFTTAGSLGAQFLLNRKYIQNWIAWIIVDVIFVWMYYVNGLHDFAAQYFVFLVLAIVGLVQWNRLHREQFSDRKAQRL